MKRFLIVCALFLLISVHFSLNARAYGNETEQSIAENAGALDLESDYLTQAQISGDEGVNIFERALTIIYDAFTDGKSTCLASFGALLAVVILSSILNALKFDNDNLEAALSYISVLAISGVAYSILYKLFVVVIASMEALTLATSSLLPIMASLHVFGGTVATGAASSAGIATFLTLLSNLCTRVLMPLLRISFALCLSGAMPSCVNLSSLTSLIKNTLTSLTAFLFSLMSFALYLQSSVASASDSFLMRSVKFATGVFVPVIGGVLGDATRTVAASVSVVKGSVGAVGIVMVLSAVLPPLITVAMHKLLLLGCAITAKTLSCERESMFLYELCGMLNVLLALVAGACVVSIIFFAILIKSGAAV